MLYLLSYFSDFFGPFRLFEYVTFRAGGAAITSFLIVLLLGRFVANALRSLNAMGAERLKDVMPPEMIDKEKSKTPCMGGILIIGAVVISGILWTKIASDVAPVLIGGTACFAVVGFIDDFMKVYYKNNAGLKGKYKFALLTLISSLILFAFSRSSVLGPILHDFYVPFVKEPLFSSFFSLAFAVVVLVGSSNAVNLTDGKDGLASGCTIFCVLTYVVFCYLMSHKGFANYLSIPYIRGAEEAVVFGLAVCGACIGFLWHNCHPAIMFMGDTGSLALGGVVGMMAVLVRQELLLVLVGFVFVMEAGSVIIQVGCNKLFHKRPFRCTPIHHHFEYKNWTETQIVVRFWIIAGISSLLALATLKLR